MQIEISEPLFKRLQNHAVPFVDTPANVIERFADFFESSHRPQSQSTATIADSLKIQDVALKLDPAHPPTFLNATVRGEFGSIPFSNWNDLMRVAHIEAFKKAQSFEVLRTVTGARISKGTRSDSGYRYLPEIGISLQGVDADRAWRHSFRLAVYLQTPLKAWVTWRHNASAAFPGESKFISWSP